MPSKLIGIKSHYSHTYIRQNKFQNKCHKKRQRKSLPNTEWKNSLRRNKHSKHICTQHWSALIYKENLGVLQERNSKMTLILGDFNTPLYTIDRPSKQRISKDIVALNDALDQVNLSDIYRTFHPKEAKCTFFSNTHGTFSEIDHIIGHKTSVLNKFKKIEITSSIFSGHNGLKLETNLKEKTQEQSNSWRLNNMLLNNKWVNSEIKKKSRSLWKQMKMNTE